MQRKRAVVLIVLLGIALSALVGMQTEPVFAMLPIVVALLAVGVAVALKRRRERSGDHPDVAEDEVAESVGDEWGIRPSDRDEDPLAYTQQDYAGPYTSDADVESDRAPGLGAWQEPAESQWQEPAESQWQETAESQWQETAESQWQEPAESQWQEPAESQWQEPAEAGTFDDQALASWDGSALPSWDAGVAAAETAGAGASYEPAPAWDAGGSASSDGQDYEPLPIWNTFSAEEVIEDVQSDDDILAASQQSALHVTEDLSEEEVQRVNQELLSRVHSLLAKYE